MQRMRACTHAIIVSQKYLCVLTVAANSTERLRDAVGATGRQCKGQR